MASTIEEIKLIIPLPTYQKIMAYIQLCDTEISGFAEVAYNIEKNSFIAGEVFLLEQEATGTHVEMDEETVSKFNIQYTKKHFVKGQGVQLPRIWWHSHVNMEAFFSATDEETLKELQNDTFIIALVGNKRAEMKAKCYVAQNVPMLENQQYIEVDPLHVTIDLEYAAIPEELKKEVETKVKKKVFVHEKPIQRSLYSGKQANAGEGIKGALTLPKDPALAQSRIDDLGLVMRWNYTIDDWVWVNLDSGQVWVDYWHSIERFGQTLLGSGADKGDDGKRTVSPDVNEMLQDMEDRGLLDDDLSDEEIEKGMKN